MFLDSLGLAENPFKVTPDPRLAFRDPSFLTLRDRLIAALEPSPDLETRSGIDLIVGEAGTGKTTMLRELEQGLLERRRAIRFTSCKQDQTAIALIAEAGDATRLLLDECEKLPPEELPLLIAAAVARGITLVAAGLPRIVDTAACIPQDLLTLHMLRPLTPEAVGSYIAARLTRAG